MRTMQRHRLSLAVGIALAAAALAAPTAYAQDFTWNGRIAAGKAVEIKGVNGSIRAIPADGDDVVVDAVKRGRRSNPDEVEVVVLEHEWGITICALYPTPRGERPNECAPGEGGRMNTRNNDVQVDFTVRLPADVRFIARTVNGRVSAEGLGSDVYAVTVNGDVEVETAGTVEARTVNGSIRATFGRADWTGDVEFKTVNGSITLELPVDLDADVKATTVNGSITTDFPLLVQGKLARNRLTGRVGQGGRELSIETVNGSIRIRKST